MEQDPADFFQEMKLLVSDYVEARTKLFKLEMYEKTAKISASLFSSIVIVVLSSLMLLFGSIALGFYLGSLFNSLGTGFLIVTGIYLILLLPIILFRKNWIEKTIVNSLIEKLTEKEEGENES
jgi:hypothetical protein